MAVNLTTSVLVIVTSVTLVFVAPAMIAAGPGPLEVVHLVVALAMLVLAILVRRGRRWAWLALVGLLVFDAATGLAGLILDDGADVAAVSVTAAVSLALAALLVVPRSSRAYFARAADPVQIDGHRR